MPVNEAHGIDDRMLGTDQVPDDSTSQRIARLRGTLKELAKWRIDPSLIEVLEDTGYNGAGWSTVSRAFLASSANTSSSSIELGDDESELKSSGENHTRKLVRVERLRTEDTYDLKARSEAVVREARILVELSHDNVVKLEGFVEDIAENRVWLIYLWEEYGDLKNFVASQDWEVPERISLMHDVTQGVEYLHSRDPPIGHFDLKARNVFITSKCRAVITGFYSARRLTNAGLGQETGDEGFQYTLRWTAPEVLIDNKPGLGSDIWSLAWVFYEIMTKCHPFEDIKKESNVIRAIVRGDLPSVNDDARILLIPTLGKLLIKCWNMDPRKRPTAEMCRDMLDWAPKAIPNPLRFSESAATTKPPSPPHADKSPPPAEEKIDGHQGAQVYEDRPKPPSQHPSTVDPSHSPTHLTSTPIEATNEDHSPDAMPAETDSDGSETILRSILDGVAHLSVAPAQLTVIDSAEVGRGGYGDVLLATLNRPSQMPIQVAVKELRTVETGGVRRRIALRLARELKIWAKVNHPNILPLIGYYLRESDGIARFISPLMTNGNVSQYLKRTQAGILRRLDILRDITAGMDYLHGHIPPICHADLKPPNILINDTLQAVLCDFGLASFIQEAGVSSGLTTSRTIKGSLRYMSPELNLDDDAKHTLESDIWAWGCTAFEIMTDCIPYRAANKDTAILLAIVQKKPPGSIETLISQLPDNISLDAHPALPGLRDYLPQCWNFEAQQRPEMSRILHELFPNTIHHTPASS